MPGPNQRHLQLSATAKRLADAVLRPAAERIDSDREFPRANLDAIAATGLLGLTVPRRYGGLGATARDLVVVCEIFGAACASTAMVYLMHAIGCRLIASGVSPAQGSRWQRAAATGDALATLAFSEPAAGAGSARPDMSARKVAGGYRLSGRKSFVTSGGHASLYPVLASTQAGLSVFVVTPDMPDVRFEGRWSGLGLAGNSSVDLVLEDVLVPGTSLLGRDGQGMELHVRESRPYFYAGLAAVNCGIALAAFDATLEHARQRRHNTGRSLAQIPAVQSHLAQMSVELEAARQLVREAARAATAAEDGAERLLMQAKLSATEAARSITQRAMQVGGGTAYGRGLPIERFWRDAHAGVVMVPANDALRETLGRRLAGIPDP